MELLPTVDGYYLFVGLKDEKMALHKKILKKRASKKILLRAGWGGEKSESSPKFDDDFDIGYVVPLPKGHKTKGTWVPTF